MTPKPKKEVRNMAEVQEDAKDTKDTKDTKGKKIDGSNPATFLKAGLGGDAPTVNGVPTSSPDAPRGDHDAPSHGANGVVATDGQSEAIRALSNKSADENEDAEFFQKLWLFAEDIRSADPGVKKLTHLLQATFKRFGAPGASAVKK